MSIDAFYGLDNLGNLRIDRCLLRLMPPIADVKDTLHTLWITRNLITHIPAGYFEDLPQLTTLDLSNNQLPHFPDVSPINRTLHTLSLRSNYIITIPSFMVTTIFIALEFLSLRDNNIHTLPPSFVSNCPNLRQLFIAKNNLLTLDKSIFDVEGAMILSLSGNPWRCDSALAWLCDLDFMNHRMDGVVRQFKTYGRVGIRDYVDLVCTGPRVFAGMNIKNLRMSSTTSVSHQTCILFTQFIIPLVPKITDIVNVI